LKKALLDRRLPRKDNRQGFRDQRTLAGIGQLALAVADFFTPRRVGEPSSYLLC
jgi:hypothetical protein